MGCIYLLFLVFYGILDENQNISNKQIIVNVMSKYSMLLWL